MKEIIIKKEENATRCDVCHKSDYYNVSKNSCERCKNILKEFNQKESIKASKGRMEKYLNINNSVSTGVKIGFLAGFCGGVGMGIFPLFIALFDRQILMGFAFILVLGLFFGVIGTVGGIVASCLEKLKEKLLLRIRLHRRILSLVLGTLQTGFVGISVSNSLLAFIFLIKLKNGEATTFTLPLFNIILLFTFLGLIVGSVTGFVLNLVNGMDNATEKTH
ncbi:MAG: hypothetical protein WAQ98_15710 [Blastocatellia bacterium]